MRNLKPHHCTSSIALKPTGISCTLSGPFIPRRELWHCVLGNRKICFPKLFRFSKCWQISYSVFKNYIISITTNHITKVFKYWEAVT